MRTLKPCLRLRRRTLGWYVRFIEGIQDVAEVRQTRLRIHRPPCQSSDDALIRLDDG